MWPCLYSSWTRSTFIFIHHHHLDSPPAQRPAQFFFSPSFFLLYFTYNYLQNHPTTTVDLTGHIISSTVRDFSLFIIFFQLSFRFEESSRIHHHLPPYTSKWYSFFINFFTKFLSITTPWLLPITHHDDDVIQCRGPEARDMTRLECFQVIFFVSWFLYILLIIIYRSTCPLSPNSDRRTIFSRVPEYSHDHHSTTSAGAREIRCVSIIRWAEWCTPPPPPPPITTSYRIRELRWLFSYFVNLFANIFF